MAILYNIENTALNDFDLTAKDILEKYYFSPYQANPKKNEYQKPPHKINIRDGQIERPVHGTMHASRVAAFVDHFHAMHKKYDDTVNEKLESLAMVLGTTPKTLLLLTKYAALFHDSARQAEGIDYWDEQSAENGRRYLIKQGVPEQLAKLVAIAAANKDNSDKDATAFKKEIAALNKRFGLNVDATQMDYLRRLIGDSDCLDIIRGRSAYAVSYLHFYQKYQNNEAAMVDLANTCKMAGDVIYRQYDGNYACSLQTDNAFIKKNLANLTLVEAASFDEKQKLSMEQAANPYTATVAMLQKSPVYLQLKTFVPTQAAAPSTPKPKKPANKQDMKQFAIALIVGLCITAATCMLGFISQFTLAIIVASFAFVAILEHVLNDASSTPKTTHQVKCPASAEPVIDGSSILRFSLEKKAKKVDKQADVTNNARERFKA